MADEQREFWKEFGLEPPVFEDNLDSMPPVDEGEIRKLVRNELPEADALRIASYLRRFRPWNDACSQISQEEWVAKK